MSEVGLIGFAPLWLLSIAACGLLATDAFARRREAGFQRNLALLAVALVFVASWRQLGEPGLDLGTFALGGFLIRDHLTVTSELLVVGALFAVIALARSPRPAGHGDGEREPLLLLAGVGALLCVHAGDLVTVWLGVELLAVASLAAWLASSSTVPAAARRQAMLVQLVPGMVASLILLLGVALIYAGLGTTSLDNFGRQVTRLFADWGGVQRWVGLLDQLSPEVAAREVAVVQRARSEIVRGLAPPALFLPGVLLLLAGILAKLGLLPFARRREFVEAAPLHITALTTTVAAVALFTVLLRVYVGGLHSPRMAQEPYGWPGALSTVALLTGVWASVAALRQRRLSRIVALLGAVQLSLQLLALVAAATFHGRIAARVLQPQREALWSRLVGDEAYATVLVLLTVQVIATLGAFAALAASRGVRGPEVRLQHWAGMASRRPGLALALALCLLSLVGLPPLAGFVGKLGLLRALAEHSAMRWMLFIVVIELALSAWVALRVVATLYFGDDPISEPGEREAPGPWPARVATVAAALSVLLGLGGQHLLAFARLPAAVGVYEPGDPARLDWLEARRAAWAAEAEPAGAPEPDVAEAEADDSVEDSGAASSDRSIEANPSLSPNRSAEAERPSQPEGASAEAERSAESDGPTGAGEPSASESGASAD